MYQHCTTIWYSLNPAEKAHWTSEARNKAITPYALFMSTCLKPNPGIYLPLIGGIMKGDIDMNTFRILDLTDPLVDQEAATKKYVDDIGGGASGEGHITILPLSYDSIGQGAWQPVMNAAFYLQGLTQNASNTNGDNLSYKIYLDAGTYTLLFLSDSDSALAIADFDLDAVEIASFNTYAPGATRNVRYTQTGIIVASPGLKTLKLRVDGRHASASQWIINIHYIALWRTA